MEDIMAQVYPHDFSIECIYIQSASYWSAEGSHSEHKPSSDQQHDYDPAQPCDPADEESPDTPGSDDEYHRGGTDSDDKTIDPPENAGELGGDEDTPQW